MSVFVDERKPVLFLKQAIADAASVDVNEVNPFFAFLIFFFISLIFLLIISVFLSLFGLF